MLSPEERKAYLEWRRKQYPEHYALKARVLNAKKKGIKDPEKYARERLLAQKRFKEQLKLEEEFPWLRIGRLANEKKKQREKTNARSARKRKLKKSESYIEKLIALEKELSK